MTKRILAGPPAKRRWTIFLAIAFLLSLAAYLPFDYTAHKSAEFYFFEADMVADHSGRTQVYYDMGKGFNEGDSSLHRFTASSESVHHWYALPTGVLRQLRFDFSDGPGHYSISHARITDFKGKVLRVFSPSDFTFGNEIARLDFRGETISAIVSAGRNDPYIGTKLTVPLKLEYGWPERMLVIDEHLLPGLLILIVSAGVSLLVTSRFSHGLGLARLWCAENPIITIATLAALSVAIQLHPVIFSGKSFVSPNVDYFLYDTFPSVPGYTETTMESFKGSDVAALVYAHMPDSKLEYKAVFHDHELPLWNRYDLAGTPLLGQGQSMFGEVLNLIPLLAKGASWSWDLKFVIARWVFGFALGYFVYKVSESQTAAVLVALFSPWIGFFEYRANHPAQFSLCLSPLILVAWAHLSRAETRRSITASAAFLAFAHWEMITSGTVKEAYITMLLLDLAGLVYLVARNGFTVAMRRQVAAAIIAGFIFVLVAAPLWLTFLDTLAVSHTTYDVPFAWQIPGWQFIGIFEDMFYRRFNPFENHANPSANAVALLGVAWLLASLFWTRNRVAWALIVVTLVPLSFAFGIVPASLILHTPFLANVYHVGNTFSCSLIVLLLALGGLGFADLSRCLVSGEPRSRLWLALGFVAFLYGIYLLHSWGQPRSSFFAGYIASLSVAILALILGFLNRAALGGALVAVIVAAGVAELLWRHGTYNHIHFDEYVLNPPIRAALDAPSPAINAIKLAQHEPSRVTGLGQNLYCGDQQFYFEEGIYGVDAVRSDYFDKFMVAVNLPKAWTWAHQDFGGERDESRGAMDLLNVRYYLDSLDSEAPVSGLVKGPTLDLKIYESPTVWPRAFFTNNVVETRDLKLFAARLIGQTPRPFAALEPAEAQMLREQSIFQETVPANPIVSPARDYKLTTNTTSFVVDVAGPGLIVLTETFYPKDFRVFLNDKPVEYLRANYAFKGIPVSTPGTYEVRVEYWPHHLTLALMLMGAGLLIGLAMVVVPEWRRSPRFAA